LKREKGGMKLWVIAYLELPSY